MDEGLEFVYSREGVIVSELNDLFQKVTLILKMLNCLVVADAHTHTHTHARLRSHFS